MRKLAIFLYVVSMAVVLSGCVLTATSGNHPRSQTQHRGYGPPPHAPAHGYRHKHEHGVTLQFDSGIGAYVVLGHAGIYFHNGLYLRRHARGHWQSAKHYRGPWQRSAARDVPAKLDRKMRQGHRR